jgi:predicted HicB family RNase H-like nuclease
MNIASAIHPPRHHPMRDADEAVPYRSRSQAMMEYKGYVGKVEFDPDARILHGEVVGIRDVVTFQGRTVDEVEKAFRNSVDDYLAFCKKRGEQPDKPCSGQFVVRIDSNLHRKANMVATAMGTSLNAWVAECLDKEVRRELPDRRSGSKLPKAAGHSRPRKKITA